MFPFFYSSRVDTIGDAFLCASNLVEDQPDDHIKRIAEFSIDAIQAAQDTPVNLENPLLGAVQIRCGFHVGPAIGRVVGTRQPKYSVFGDAVNIGKRRRRWLVSRLPSYFYS